MKIGKVKSKQELAKERESRKVQRRELFEDQKDFDLHIEAESFSKQCRADLFLLGIELSKDPKSFMNEWWQFLRENAKYPDIQILWKLTKDQIHAPKEEILKNYNAVMGIEK